MKPTEEWRKLLFDLSDQAFFDLVRNYLGDIHTPFNKHKLLDSLEAFLLNKANLEQIISMIDSSDAALLSAVDFLGCASIGQLYSLFSDEKPYYSFYAHLMNLEERLLICPVRSEKGEQTVVISPIFKEELEKCVIDFDLFLGCRKAPAKKNTEYSWYDIPVISAYISALLAKKGKAAPSVPARNLAKDAGEIIKDILLKHSLFYQAGRHPVPVNENLKKLFSMDSRDVSRFFIQSYLASNPLETLVYDTMRTDRSYPDRAFARLVRCTAYLAGLDAGDIESCKEHLLKSALAVEESTGIRKLTSIQSTGNGNIVVQPDFSLYVQGTLDAMESLALAFYSEIRDLDVISRWEVKRESFMRGIRSGISPSTFIALLEEKSGAELPQNILYSFKSWEEECRGIAIYQGCVIKADERFSNLLDNNSIFKKYMQEKLGVGIYLVSEDNAADAMKVVEGISGQSLVLPMEKKNIDVLPAIEKENNSSRFKEYENPVPRAKKRDISEKLLKKIEELDITEEQKDILSDRVHRRLILSEKQLDSGSVRYELMEARGIDYNRKVRLCQHVMELGGAFLELTVGSEGTLLVKPLQLKKSGNDMLLIGDEIPDGFSVQVPLRKVRYMRKVRTSLMA
ncbi:MAG: hypothetical protein II890_07255 [Spirochaetia bacterium]|nr:hypothetical protein [Spirochaetia bacterium]